MHKETTWVGLALFAIIGATAIYSFSASRFVPSDEWQKLSLVPAILCTIAGAYLALKPAPGHPKISGIGLVFTLFLVFFGSYHAFVAGFPAWYTQFAGVPGARIVTVKDWRTGSLRGACKGPDIMEASFVNTICLDESYAAKALPGTKLQLIGYQTWLGINVSQVRFPIGE